MAQAYVFEYGVGGVPNTINSALLAQELARCLIVYAPNDHIPQTTVLFQRIEEDWDALADPTISIRGIPGLPDVTKFSVFWTDDITNGATGGLASAEAELLNIIQSHDSSLQVQSVEKITQSGLVRDYHFEIPIVEVSSPIPISLIMPDSSILDEGVRVRFRNQGIGLVTFSSTSTLASKIDPIYLATGGQCSFILDQRNSNYICEIGGDYNGGGVGESGPGSPSLVQMQEIQQTSIISTNILVSNKSSGIGWNDTGVLGSDSQVLDSNFEAFEWVDFLESTNQVILGLVPAVNIGGADPAQFLSGGSSPSKGGGFIFYVWINGNEEIEIATSLAGGVELEASKQKWRQAITELGLRLQIGAFGQGEFRTVTDDFLLGRTLDILPATDYRLGIKLVNANSQVKVPYWIGNAKKGITGQTDTSVGASEPYVPTSQVNFDGGVQITLPQDANNEDVLKWDTTWEIDILVYKNPPLGKRVSLINNGENSIGLASNEDSTYFYLRGENTERIQWENSLKEGDRLSVSFDGVNVNIYVNAVFKGSHNVIPVNGITGSDFTLGPPQTSFLGSLFGSYSELRLYNRVLTEEERESVFANPNPAEVDVTLNFFSSVVVGYWPFSGIGTTVDAIVGSNGTLTNEEARILRS